MTGPLARSAAGHRWLYERLDITGIRGLTEAQKASLRALRVVERVPAPDIQHAP